MVPAYPVEWLILASAPMLMWIAVFAYGSVRSRSGELRVQANVFAVIGALLAFVSFATEWGVSESGYDWVAVTSMSLFLLFTYPLSAITPLAGLGQIGVLLWVLGFSWEHDALISPLYGYLLAWVSSAFMIAGMVRPAFPCDRAVRMDAYDRLLTITIRRRSGPRTSGRDALIAVLSTVFLAVGTASLVLRGTLDSLIFLLIGLVFVVYMLRFCDMALVKPGPCTPSGSRKVGASARSGMAWMIFIGASYSAAVIGFSVVVGSLESSGYSGEERTDILVYGGATFAFAAAVAFVAQRRAVAPPTPKNLTVASVILFSLFTLMASLRLSGLPLGDVSAAEYMVLAGLVLVMPSALFLQAGSRGSDPSGGPSS